MLIHPDPELDTRIEQAHADATAIILRKLTTFDDVQKAQLLTLMSQHSRLTILAYNDRNQITPKGE
jgi:hypothetical protein